MLTSRPHRGTVVHLEERLERQEGSVVQRRTEDQPAPEDGPWSCEETMDDAPAKG